MQGCHRIRVRAIGALLLLLMIGGSGMSVRAAEVLLVHEAGKRYQAVFAESLGRRLNQGGQAVVRAVDLDALDLAEAPALIVTVGSSAARRVRKLAPERPLIHALLPRRAYETLPTADAAKTGIFLDQPVARYLALIRAALPASQKVVSLHGPGSLGQIPGLRQSASRLGLQFEPRVVETEQGIPQILDEAVRPADVLLTLPDPVVVNSATARTLIMGAYQRDIALVGYSQAYVKAGALMAVFSPPESIARQVAELAGDYFRTGALPAAGPPKYFEVAVNYQLARTLGLSVPREALLQEKVEREAAGENVW